MIALHQHHISANITNRYATVTYLFDFENVHETSSHELKFELTIDPDAFISRFEANIDGKLFVGQTKEKETASKEYTEAKQKDENAILISQPHKDIPNVFQIKTHIDSKSKVSLTITIEQYLQKKLGFNELTVQILRNFEQYNIQPRSGAIQFECDLFDEHGIDDVCTLSAMTNESNNSNDSDWPWTWKRTLDKSHTRCEIEGTLMRDTCSSNEVSIRYKTKGEAEECRLLFDSQSGTFCHIVSDIAMQPQITTNVLIPRRVVFVVDKSGSMNGNKWTRAVSATIAAIKALRAGVDKFSLILFDHECHGFKSNDEYMLSATDKTKQSAIRSIQVMEAGGGTSFRLPLMNAVNLLKVDINAQKNAYYTNQIIFITDGEDNGLQQLLVDVNKANNLDGIDKYNKKISIFTFGVGRDDNDSGWIGDVNHSFLKSLALNNCGFYKRIKMSSAETAMTQYFNILSKPVLTDIRVDYHSKNVSDLTDVHFNTLYHGNDLIICGKIQNPQQQSPKLNELNITITGTTCFENASSPEFIHKQMTLPLEASHSRHRNVERMWAYLKLQQYAKRRLMHNDMIELDDEEKSEGDKAPLALALKYQFVTPWTSMIVVKHKEDDVQPEPEQCRMNAQKQEQQQRPPLFDANAKLGVCIATKYDLSGAGNIFQTRFDQLVAQGQYPQAAKLAADAPQGVLRNHQNIARLQNAPNIGHGNGPPADLQYYTSVLQKGTLNKTESVGLSQRILQFRPNEGRRKIEQLLRAQKLESSEELGDLLARHDPKLAASVFYRARSPAKTILCFIQLGQASKIVKYCKAENYTPKWADLLGHVQRLKRDDVVSFAQLLVDEGHMSALHVVEVLLADGRNDVEKATEFLLEYLRNRGDRKEDSELQTKLLELTLRAAPRIANGILPSNEDALSHFKRNPTNSEEKETQKMQEIERVDLMHDVLRVDALNDLVSGSAVSVECTLSAQENEAFEAYNKGGIVIVVHFSVISDQKCRVLAVTKNLNECDVTSFEMQLTVPTYLGVRMYPATGSRLTGLGGDTIEQEFEILNKCMAYWRKRWILSMKLSYMKNGNSKKTKDAVTIHVSQ